MRAAGLQIADIWVGNRVANRPSSPRTVLVSASQVQPPRKPTHPERTRMAGHPSRLVGSPRGKSGAGELFHALFIHFSSLGRVPCWCNSLESPQAGRGGPEGPRLPRWPLLSKWTWRAWNAGLGRPSPRLTAAPRRETRGSSPGCRLPGRVLGEADKEGSEVLCKQQ